jgi:hypothetical protein
MVDHRPAQLEAVRQCDLISVSGLRRPVAFRLQVMWGRPLHFAFGTFDRRLPVLPRPQAEPAEGALRQRQIALRLRLQQHAERQQRLNHRLSPLESLHDTQVMIW